LKILVTGSTGFVGHWLVRDLQASGHLAVGTPPSAELDLLDRDAVAKLIERIRPDAVAHLAAVSYGPDARRDPDHAFAVNVAGTQALIAAITAASPGAALLVAGSSEVYGHPRPQDLPLSEDAPTEPTQPYGLSKLAQERAALTAADRYALNVVVARSFNHTGPGQRPEFVAPALAQRVLAARAAGDREIPVGNVDVRRDLGDVRDVVRAYRLLLEGVAAGTIGSGSVVNVATGRGVAIREVLAILSRLAGVDAEPRVDATLVRADDPPEIVGDASRLKALTGWIPEIGLEQTLADLLASIEATPT